jgi:threonine synthase
MTIDADVTKTRAMELVCRDCGMAHSFGPMLEGCPSCSTAAERRIVEVRFDLRALRRARIVDEWSKRPLGLWSYHETLPVPQGAVRVSMQEGGTPLVHFPSKGPARIWVKDETRNPTLAHKDRFHSVSVTVARHLGFKKVTAATTGNHGVSLAAYAARADLRSLIFHDPQSPAVLCELSQLFGARVIVTEARLKQIAWLVQERGWYPSTGLTPEPVGTPFGIEAYKSIAFETTFQLGRRYPHRFYVPVAQGDILYGIWKGFREIAVLSENDATTRMHAVQSSGCDPIVEAFRKKLKRIPVHPSPDTVALSIGDATGAAITLDALAQSDGEAVAVSDERILKTVRCLAGIGIAAEPSGAAALAAALEAEERGQLKTGEDVVCLVTGAAVKWPGTIRLSLEPNYLASNDTDALKEWIRAFDVQ